VFSCREQAWVCRHAEEFITLLHLHNDDDDDDNNNNNNNSDNSGKYVNYIAIRSSFFCE
jgi:hypothetical protein